MYLNELEAREFVFSFGLIGRPQRKTLNSQRKLADP